METLVTDTRHALRRLRQTPGATAVAILTLAVGIGAATSIFSVVYAALLRPLPFAEPGRLAMLYTTRTTVQDGTRRGRWSHADITAIRPGLRSFEDVASFTRASVTLAGGDAPQQIYAEIVSPEYFRVLRAAPRVGRLFHEDVAADPTVVISEGLWRRRFGSDPAILGRSIAVNSIPVTIAGVLAGGFSGLSDQADVWLPAALAPRVTYPGYLTTSQHFILLIGRLRPGVSFAEADAEAAAAASRVVTNDSPSPSEPVAWGAAVVPLSDARIEAGVRRSAWLLLAGAACVLLISCVNVSSLVLAQAQRRRREIAIRLAIGSGRGRLVRQLLTESVVLGATGGALGTIVATWMMDLLVMPDVLAAGTNYIQVSAFATPSADAAFLVFAIGLTLATSVLFGLAPALGASRPGLVDALKDGVRSEAGGGRRLAALVITEVALAVVLLAGAGLVIKSLSQMRALGRGVTRAGVLSFWVNPPSSRYPDEQGPAIVDRVLARVREVPGVESAAVNRCVPSGTTCSRTLVFFPDRPAAESSAPAVGRHYVSTDYFRTIGVPLLRGRTLTADDRAGRPPVAVVNEHAAKRFWPGEDPVGKHVWFGSGTGFTSRERPVEIVGVVADVKYGPPDEPIGPDFYTSYLQFAYPSTMVLVKLDAQTPASIASLRAAVASVDGGFPIDDVHTLDERAADTLSRPRFNAVTTAMFAAAALFLAAIGVYGVMAYSVSTRSREMGVRMALGADPTRLLRLVVREGIRLAAAGATIGLVSALALTRLMRSLLFGVAPFDPAIFTLVAALMIAVALAAAFVPARRASRVDPVVVLRGE
jgi:putative ABC transport system permease protein